MVFLIRKFARRPQQTGARTASALVIREPYAIITGHLHELPIGRRDANVYRDFNVFFVVQSFTYYI